MSSLHHQLTLAELERSAAAGDPKAQLRLARLFLHGHRGAKKDIARACALLEASAKAGSGTAARCLGDVHFRGDGVAQDGDAALHWYRMAAELGDAPAQGNVAYAVLQKGDEAEGLRWLERAAAQGQPYARSELQRRRAPLPEVPPPTLLEFGLTPLIELAEVGDDGARTLVARFTGEPTDITEACAVLLGALDATWPRTDWIARLDGEVLDFPGPDPLPSGVLEDFDSIEIELHPEGEQPRYGLNLSFDADEETWEADLSSLEPHPGDNEWSWMCATLDGCFSQAGLRPASDASD